MGTTRVIIDEEKRRVEYFSDKSRIGTDNRRKEDLKNEIKI